MRLIDDLKKKNKIKEYNDNSSVKPDKEYLKSLIQDVNKKFKQFEYKEIDENGCDIFYIPSKNLSYVGLQIGLSEQARLMKNNIQEATKIRSNCKNYVRLIKKDNQTIKIESTRNGRIDCIYLAYYENNRRYLFPYTTTGHRYPTYISVTHFEDEQVMEEYLVLKDAIAYSRYGKKDENKVDYYYVNYVPNGKYPVLEEKTGYYSVDSLEYVETECDVWNQDRQS